MLRMKFNDVGRPSMVGSDVKDIFETTLSREVKKASPRPSLTKFYTVQERQFDVSQKNTDYCFLGEIG